MDRGRASNGIGHLMILLMQNIYIYVYIYITYSKYTT